MSRALPGGCRDGRDDVAAHPGRPGHPRRCSNGKRRVRIRRASRDGPGPENPRGAAACRDETPGIGTRTGACRSGAHDYREHRRGRGRGRSRRQATSVSTTAASGGRLSRGGVRCHPGPARADIGTRPRHGPAHRHIDPRVDERAARSPGPVRSRRRGAGAIRHGSEVSGPGGGGSRGGQPGIRTVAWAEGPSTGEGDLVPRVTFQFLPIGGKAGHEADGLKRVSGVACFD